MVARARAATHPRGQHRSRRSSRLAWKAASMAVLAAAYLLSPAEPPASPGPGAAALGPAATPSPSPTPTGPDGEAGLGHRPPEPGVPDVSGEGIDYPANPTYQRASVEQYGITWHFDGDQTVGQYANGDWWVVGPVTLTRIEPDATDDSHGENINPRNGDEGYDLDLGRVQWLDFPLVVEAGSSVVKGVSRTSGGGDHRGELQTAAVLTVVAEPPAKNGATVFRPPYFAQDKPQYLTTDLRTELLPVLDPPGDVPSLDGVAETFQRVQLDHNTGNAANRRLHPVDNMADYGADIAVDTNQAALRLMLADPLTDKAQALINYVQYGIDLSAMVAHDSHVCADTNQNCAGHGPGRALPLVFAATMLDSPEINGIIAEKAEDLPENYSVTRRPDAPTPLFGDVVCDEELYEQVRGGGSGPRSCRDPYGYIDGGDSPGRYQVCCMSQPWKGAVTAMHLMPELAQTWPQSDKLIEYVDRFVTFGLWMSPDPHGRFESAHGTDADSGHYRVALADALWDEHNLADRVTIDWNNP